MPMLQSHLINLRRTFANTVKANIATIQNDINSDLGTAYNIAIKSAGSQDAYPCCRLVWPNKGPLRRAQNEMTCVVDLLDKALPGTVKDSTFMDLLIENFLDKLNLTGRKIHDYTLIPVLNYYAKQVDPLLPLAPIGRNMRVELKSNGFELRKDPDPNMIFYQAIFGIFLRR